MDGWQVVSAREDAFALADAAHEIASLAAELRSAAEASNPSVPVWELWDESPTVGRAAIQVEVTADVFDWFFNSPEGYRAMFRRGRRVGCAANAALIDVVTSRCSVGQGAWCAARRANHDPRAKERSWLACSRGSVVQWTDGCVGLSNKDMDAVWSAVDVGTAVQIYP